MSKKLCFVLLFFFILTLAAPVAAQGAEYQVHPRRNFGYGAGSDVRGTFSLTMVGNQDNIRSVTYQLDGKEMGAVSVPPFEFKFNTGSYPSGLHQVTAVVDTKDGRQVTTPPVRLNFLSADQESQSMQKLLIPLLGGIFLVILVTAGVQVLVMRGKKPLAPGTSRSYGVKGGTICPRCGRAYAIHFWSLNLPGGYLDRCDFCGKWAFVRSRSRADLDAAVQAEAAAAQNGESSLPAVQGAQGAQSEEERLRKMMDESRYIE